MDDHTLVRQDVGAFLKVFDDIQLRDDVALQLSSPKIPAIVVIDVDESNDRVAEREANDRKTNPGSLPAK